MLETKLKFLIIVLVYLTRLQNGDASKRISRKIDYIQDPRKNSSYYDLIINENQKYGSLIGNVGQILMKKQKITDTNLIFNYKLIYYSPQIIPSSLFSSSKVEDLSDSNTSSLFSIDPKNGSIYINTPSNEPTLEYLCLKRSFCSCYSCIFSLNLIYSTENKINTESIQVFIDDQNDHAPLFYSQVNDHFTVNVSESSLIGDFFKLNDATAYDLDAYYNEISYYLSDQDISISDERSNLFEVTKSDVPESKDLNLILKIHLDYEVKTQYELFLIAKDNGGLINVKKLVINVLDENDNSPVCEKSLFIESIYENEIAKNFLQIRASDIDSGLNGQLQYSIDASNQELIHNLFEIDSFLGWLTIKQPLDYEKKTFYNVIIKVNDSNYNNSFTTYCTARVNLLDLNDNPAKIKIIKYLNESVQLGYYSLNTMSDNEANLDFRLGGIGNSNEFKNQIEFYENNKPNLVLALIRVFDYDTLSNYKFTIHSSTNINEDMSMFEIRMSDRSNREYELIAVRPFDSENIQIYRLQIVLYDLQNLDDLKSDQSLVLKKRPTNLSNQNNFRISLFERIKILDKNDNGPQFMKKNYQISVKENEFKIPLNKNRSRIEVLDTDTSEKNSKLKFKILDKHNTTISNRFSIDETNNNYPILILMKSFDYEIDGSSYEFTLVAYDVDGLTDSTLISITIEDTNDNTPIFMNENATFIIKENMQINSFIGQVISLDKDSIGPNSDISYRILFENHRNIFKIYKSGVISNKAVFDRESQSIYNLKVEAYDNGVPIMSNIANFYIKIEDENDNKPKFLHPNENVRYMHFKFPDFKQLPNKVNKTQIKLFDVKATDLDEGNNAKISYFIKDSCDLLRINEKNGMVYLNFENLNISYLKDLNDFKKVIDVILKVKDSGVPSLSSSINFVLYLNYDSHELPKDVFNIMQYDLMAISNRLNINKYEDFGLQKNNNNTLRMTNFFQIVSNSVLIVILMVVLMFMIFVACFLLVTMFKKNTVVKKQLKHKNSEEPDNNFGNQMKKFLKNHCLLKINHGDFNSKEKNSSENLTVKDASSNEIIMDLPTVTDSNLNTNINLTATNTEQQETKNLKKDINGSNEYNIYNFDDVEYTHVSYSNQNNLISNEETKQQNNLVKIANIDNTLSSSNNHNNNIQIANPQINASNNSDTISSFNMSIKDNLPDNSNKLMFHVQQNDSSSLIIDLNGSSRSNCSSTDSSKCSYVDDSNISHNQLNLYDCNQMLDQFNNDYRSFKCRVVPATFSSNFNENLNSNSIRTMLKPIIPLRLNEAELVVKDDSSSSNDLHLLQNLLDKFENLYHGPVANMEKNIFDGSKNL